jgi:uncharacterized protein YneF (UPF0154 family)
MKLVLVGWVSALVSFAIGYFMGRRTRRRDMMRDMMFQAMGMVSISKYLKENPPDFEKALKGTALDKDKDKEDK